MDRNKLQLTKHILHLGLITRGKRPCSQSVIKRPGPNVASEGYVGRTTILALRRHALRWIRRGNDIYVADRHPTRVRLGRVCVCMYEAQLLHGAHRLSKTYRITLQFNNPTWDYRS